MVDVILLLAGVILGWLAVRRADTPDWVFWLVGSVLAALIVLEVVR